MTPTKENGPIAVGRGMDAVAASQGGRRHRTGERYREQHLRLPPYARALADARRRGLVPVLQGLGHLTIVLEWEEPGPAGMPRVVLPAGTAPELVNLGFVAGLAVCVVHTDREAGRIAAVVDALLAAGAVRVEAVNREALARGDGLDAAWPRFEREVLRHAA